MQELHETAIVTAMLTTSTVDVLMPMLAWHQVHMLNLPLAVSGWEMKKWRGSREACSSKLKAQQKSYEEVA